MCIRDRYHYSNNKSDFKKFVEVNKGAHSIIGTELSQCQNNIWSNIMEGDYNFSAVLDKKGRCLLP